MFTSVAEDLAAFSEKGGFYFRRPAQVSYKLWPMLEHFGAEFNSHGITDAKGRAQLICAQKQQPGSRRRQAPRPGPEYSRSRRLTRHERNEPAEVCGIPGRLEKPS